MIPLSTSIGVLILTLLCSVTKTIAIYNSAAQRRQLREDDFLVNFYTSKDTQNSPLNMESEVPKEDSFPSFKANNLGSNEVLLPSLQSSLYSSEANTNNRKSPHKEISGGFQLPEQLIAPLLYPHDKWTSNKGNNMYLVMSENAPDMVSATTKQLKTLESHLQSNSAQNSNKFELEEVVKPPPDGIQTPPTKKLYPATGSINNLTVTKKASRSNYHIDTNPIIWHIQRKPLMEDDKPSGLVRISPSSFDYNGRQIYKTVQAISQRLNKIHKQRMDLEKVRKKTSRGLKKLDMIIHVCDAKLRVLDHEMSNSKLRLKGLLDIMKEKSALDDAVSKNLKNISKGE